MKTSGTGEVTLAVMTDFVVIAVISKLQSLGFPKKSLFLLQNYLSERQQYIQVNGIKSLFQVNLGVLQRSLLDHVLFNVYY